MKIKTGDKVLVIRGKNKGKTGKVTDAFPREQKILVEGINKQKKHVRPKKQKEKGQTVEREAPLSVANVKLICENCGKPTRVAYKTEGGTKYRACKKCKSVIKK
ncbi:MAG: 50S ribosomal protein L24 [Candidatus Spechtbacteria bacterium RIFCSPLOWO2_01_FULL_43_12]|uniref:Large ribosomal subunit protein uL24 n=1 Tax=Candidatus Spechtbacteria bacterium RIFCSPLOWO2_01_FULL_43_12 TaxID=1802162 RepID=A0A1G2HDP1_9BACT|nr:MAG: 50S ribosomal protein L24 [Candidatus Spechtbacteria bacterium RIFCSPLOWO2_01_FULL_43_12]